MPMPERVRLIKAMMADGTFVERETRHVLAKQWGVHVSVVDRAAAEASRALRSAIADKDLAAQLVEFQRTVARSALADREYSAATTAAQNTARLAGLLSERGPDVAVTVNTSDPVAVAAAVRAEFGPHAAPDVGADETPSG